MTMSTLPKSYMKIAREISGYWGTYLPSVEMSPGIVGRLVNGMLVKEGRLEQFSGFDPIAHAIEEQKNGAPASVWKTKRVNLDVVGADIAVPGTAASAKIKLHFGGANEAAIICRGISHKSFVRLQAVKDLMRQLARKKMWDRDHCVVTEVLGTTSGWILFATEKDQVAELEGSAPLATLPGAEHALKTIAPNASVALSSSSKSSTGFYTVLQSGATPLFMAIRLNSKWWQQPDEAQIEYIKGPDQDFEEPPFGEDVT
jgi:hypothetical protein